MKSFITLSVLALSGVALAIPRQQGNPEGDHMIDIFRHPTCQNGAGSFLQQECQRMCLIPEQGQTPHPAVSATGPKPTPGACAPVQNIPVQKEITISYKTHIPGATGTAGHKATSTVIKPTPSPTFWLCTGCVDAKKQHENQKRLPIAPRA